MAEFDTDTTVPRIHRGSDSVCTRISVPSAALSESLTCAPLFPT